jgi:hypothetical protein
LKSAVILINTGSQMLKDQAGNILAEFDPVLERLDFRALSWRDRVRSFDKRFSAKAGLIRSQ